MKKLAILLIFSIISAMSFSEEELLYDEGDVSGGALVILGIGKWKCYDILFNFDVTKTDKPSKYGVNTEEDEQVLGLVINSMFDAMNYSAWHHKGEYGKRTDTDTFDYKVSRLINDCKKEKYKDGSAMKPLLNYYYSLPDVTIEDMPEEYRPKE